MNPKRSLPFLGLLLGSMTIGALQAQIVPGVGRSVGGVVGTVGGIVDPALDAVQERGNALVGSVGRLAADRLDRLRGVVASHRDVLELDDRGEPAVRGQIVGVDPSEAALAAAYKAGFAILDDHQIEGVDIRTVTLKPPGNMSLSRAIKLIRKTAPGTWTANQLHFESGGQGQSAGSGSATVPAAGGRNRIGIIDSGVARHPSLAGSIEQRGFAAGAPSPGAHGTAIASLIRGVAPDAPLVIGDVYGRDPAGGNALAIARAIGWMAQQRVEILSISLVGPANPLLARVIAAAQARGMMIVAPVGNDGPAAPPAYPASYPGVIAVTGVDGRQRVLVEAGRALHLDYAAPAADMRGASSDGGFVKLRGTSYAAPLVAARIAALGVENRARMLAALDREAIDLGRKGPDERYGRGLVCGDCAIKTK